MVSKQTYEDILERLSERYPGREVLSVQEAAKVLDTKNVEVIKRMEGIRVFKVGGRYKVALTSLARFMTGGE